MFQNIAQKMSDFLSGASLLQLSPAGVQADDSSNLTPTQAYEMMQEEKATLIDIRHSMECRQTGIAKGAVRVEMTNPRMAEEYAQEVRNAVGGKTDAPIILICRSGMRTSLMLAALTQQGFEHVYHVSGGMMGRMGAPGWVAKGLPMEPCPQC
jgi:rhodanese-related sulfurtransferase